MNFKDCEYPHSFIICNESINLDGLIDYHQFKVFNFNIYYAESYKITSIEIDNIKHILIGYALDIRDYKKSENEILQSLHISNSVIEDLEYISGRYIYIEANKGEMYIYSDASQLLPLVFHKESQTLSSHDNLLAEILLENNFNITRRPLEVHNEFDFTRYEEIQKFNPSMRLSTEDFSYHRIYPRIDIKTATVEKVAAEIQVYFSEMVKWLKDNKQVKFLTLTGGIDSRVSASLTKDIDDIEYLTYFMPDKYIKSSLAKSIYKVDRSITSEMKENMKWKHSIIDLTELSITREELGYYKSFYNSKHGYRLDKYFRESRGFTKALHIKSTVFGLGKADFPVNLDSKSSTIEYFKKSIHGISKDFEKYYSIDEETDKYFERNLIDTSVIKGRHYFDLYHLESRMGNWHSCLTLETDPETEEFIFTNSRKILDLIQLPTISEKRKFSLYKKIIEKNWPVLLFFGINESNNLYEQTNTLLKNKYKDIIIHSNRSMDVNKDISHITISPKGNEILLSENYNFIIEKENKDTKSIKLKSNYFKEEARGLIKVAIRVNNKIKLYDILDLNKGEKFEMESTFLSVSLLYNKEYSSQSWRKAGKLTLFME